MRIRHILFDLDGTLLPMNQDEFVKFYMPMLAKTYISQGIEINPKSFVGAVWQGYEAMVKNDGGCTNREAFWRYLSPLIPVEQEAAERIAEDFYSGPFNEVIASTRPTPLAAQVVKTAKEKGIKVYLATNPVFPRCATMNRIRWAGLDAADFEIITTYEDNCYCKPSLAYFQSILDRFKLLPQECLMVGNDVEEDLVIRELGVKTFLVTDTMENKKGLPVESEYTGSMEELAAFVKELEAV